MHNITLFSSRYTVRPLKTQPVNQEENLIYLTQLTMCTILA